MRIVTVQAIPVTTMITACSSGCADVITTWLVIIDMIDPVLSPFEEYVIDELGQVPLYGEEDKIFFSPDGSSLTPFGRNWWEMFNQCREDPDRTLSVGTPRRQHPRLPPR